MNHSSKHSLRTEKSPEGNEAQYKHKFLLRSIKRRVQHLLGVSCCPLWHAWRPVEPCHAYLATIHCPASHVCPRKVRSWTSMHLNRLFPCQTQHWPPGIPQTAGHSYPSSSRERWTQEPRGMLWLGVWAVCNVTPVAANWVFCCFYRCCCLDCPVPETAWPLGWTLPLCADAESPSLAALGSWIALHHCALCFEGCCPCTCHEFVVLVGKPLGHNMGRKSEPEHRSLLMYSSVICSSKPRNHTLLCFASAVLPA